MPMGSILLIVQLITIIPVLISEAFNKLESSLLVLGYFLNAVFLFMALVIFFKPNISLKSHLFMKGFIAIVILCLAIFFLDDIDLFLLLSSPSLFSWLCILILLVTKDLDYRRVSRSGMYEVTKK